MSSKDFKKGMEAGTKPFNEKFNEISEATKKIGQQINTKIDSLNEVMDIVIDDLSSASKKEIYDLNTKIDINECLDEEEKELLAAVLISISNSGGQNNTYQQKFIRAVNSYIGVNNPQVSIDLSKIENVENISSQKAILQVIMEYLFLGYGSFEFWDDYEEYLFDYFNVNKKGVKEIKECIQYIYNATGFEGISEKYGYIVEEENVVQDNVNLQENIFETYDGSDICEKCADKVNLNTYIVLDNYLVYTEMDKLFRVKKSDGSKEEINTKEPIFTEIFGQGRFLCIRYFDNKYFNIIDVETLKETTINTVGDVNKFSCNSENIFYSTSVDNEKRLCMVNFKDETRSILKYTKNNENILTADHFYVNDDFIYFTPSTWSFINENNRLAIHTLYKYTISDGNLEKLCEVPANVQHYFLWNSYTYKYNNYIYSININDKNKNYAYIKLDDPKAIRCVSIPIFGSEDITVFIGYGRIYYVMLNNKFSIHKYDIDTGESTVILEHAGCGFVGEVKTGFFKKEPYYFVLPIPQVVGKWLYFRGNTSGNILKVSTDVTMGESEIVNL